MRVGIRVYCTTCKLMKAPHGRSISDAMHGTLCDSECKGYYDQPLSGDLWPGETEKEFGYPVCRSATEEVEE